MYIKQTKEFKKINLITKKLPDTPNPHLPWFPKHHHAATTAAANAAPPAAGAAAAEAAAPSGAMSESGCGSASGLGGLGLEGMVGSELAGAAPTPPPAPGEGKRGITSGARVGGSATYLGSRGRALGADDMAEVLNPRAEERDGMNKRRKKAREEERSCA